MTYRNTRTNADIFNDGLIYAVSGLAALMIAVPQIPNAIQERLYPMPEQKVQSDNHYSQSPIIHNSTR